MQVAVLSPHRDDAAFSCGLTLHALLAAGVSLTIVNVCTVSRYAPYFSSGSGDLINQVTELRQIEDANFVNMLSHKAGAKSGQIELIDLAWQDVPVRWRMEDERALVPMSLPTEEVEKLRDVFRALPRFDIICVPMALGGHLDHRLVLQAARQAFPVASLVFYEDLPYACRMTGSERKPAEFETGILLLDMWFPVQGAAEGLKREYALSYPSQIGNEVTEEMEDYASHHGGRERFLVHAEAMQMLTKALLHKPAL